jgi:YfiH family protein
MNTVKSHHSEGAIAGSIQQIEYLTIPAFDKAGRILHAFTTRRGGLGARHGRAKQHDDWSAVANAFEIRTDRVVTVNQVHGENIITVDELNVRNARTVHADAMITNVPGIALSVETADCVPVLLCDLAKPAVAAIHAGWKSTVKKIVQKAVYRMHEEFGSESSRLIAAIGPAIGPECYEVDEPVMGPVREAFSFWKEVASPRGNDRWSLDLVKANKIELMQIGLPEKSVHTLGLCTSCRRDLFYSFRAEGRTGRMLSVIMIRP